MNTDSIVKDLQWHIAELHHKVDGQAELLKRLVALQHVAQPGATTVDAAGGSFSGVALPREKALAQALQEAILVLEETRRAFHSKQLEKLRKRLVQTLVQHSA